jgi:hypothetical protein
MQMILVVAASDLSLPDCRASNVTTLTHKQVAQLQSQSLLFLCREVHFVVAGLNDIKTAFAMATRRHVGVLVLHADPFFNGHRDEIIALAAHHAVPTFYELRDFVTAGGLISYGASLANA